MLDDLTTRDQRMLFAVVTLVHPADSWAGLNSDTETLQSIARKHLCQLSTLSWQQAESESLSKNVSWGKQKSMEAGNVSMQYSKMIGYRKDSDGKPEIVPEEAALVRRIYKMYLDGGSLVQIAKTLIHEGIPTASGIRTWSPQVVRNILTNEKYIGDALLEQAQGYAENRQDRAGKILFQIRTDRTVGLRRVRDAI